MSSPSPSRLEAIFTEALLRKGDERASYLARACGEDDELRRELEELLAAHGEAEPFFDNLASRIAQSAALELDMAARPRIRIGPYQAEEVVGHGGMGVVYRGSRTDGEFEQQVALKLLHLDMQQDHIRARFIAERQLLASFQHPNIASLLDGGLTEDGRPYIVMEYVDGRPITDWCRGEALTLEQTLRLFLQLVKAVSYLHRNLVVHRDLKPSNILVRHDGVVKLLDFGIAKLLAEDGTGEMTLTSERLLTPLYAAPEQLTGGDPTGTATDVYSLGVVLYELLTGSLPHDRSVHGAAHHQTTTSPSEALRRGQEAGAESLPAWRRLPSDLDHICLMALRSEPERRYPSAEGLGRDIELHLQGLPVVASPDTLGYRMRKFVRRHWKGVSIGAAVVVILVAGLVREMGLREETEKALLKAEAVSDFLADLFSAADPAQAQGEEVTVIEVLQRAEQLFAEGESFADDPDVESELRLVLGRTYQALGRLGDATTQLEESLRLSGGPDSGNVSSLAAAELLGNLRSLDIERREGLLARVVRARQETLGVEHNDTLSAMSGLAGVYLGQGRLEEAEELDRQVFEIRSRVFGSEHPATLKAANNLAADYFSTARYPEAAELYEGALAASRKTLGPTHPSTLRLIGNLGSTYSVLGRFAESEALLREVVEAHLAVFGERHHRTGMAMHNLGFLLRRLGQMEEAESWLRRAVDARAEASPSASLYSMSFLADTLRDLQRYEEAEQVYEETARRQEQHLGPDHADLLRTRAGLAELYRRQGRLELAEELATNALAAQQRTIGEKHLYAADTLDILARILAEEGRFDDALKRVDQAHAIRSEVFGPDHPVMLLSRLEKARLLATSDPQAARESLEVLAGALSTALGQDHPSSKEARALRDSLASELP